MKIIARAVFAAVLMFGAACTTTIDYKPQPLSLTATELEKAKKELTSILRRQYPPQKAPSEVVFKDGFIYILTSDKAHAQLGFFASVKSEVTDSRRIHLASERFRQYLKEKNGRYHVIIHSGPLGQGYHASFLDQKLATDLIDLVETFRQEDTPSGSFVDQNR